MKLIKKTLTRQELDSIRCGDRVFDESGKSGVVEDIEIVKYKAATHYYYRLKNSGTILIIV
ncbi:hypothetical protein [Pedobacter punctiformis]|uniref:Uncharacterized protein n=1 Tax=Pedobacter punctiformis TaxID=3004097 RepID=A0ABT4L9A5_9SPHI|nr:hypothetical protein [Pedobacter sp. HCMS5-2]MCZ4244277.1 hypothetical protein [Pedobacter sp. HCMS5-2]